MNALGIIEGPRDEAAVWSQLDWAAIRRCVSRLQARIVKVAGDHRVLYGAFPRLEPCAVKVACTVLRGRGGGNALLPDYPPCAPPAVADLGSASCAQWIKRLDIIHKNALSLYLRQ